MGRVGIPRVYYGQGGYTQGGIMVRISGLLAQNRENTRFLAQNRRKEAKTTVKQGGKEAKTKVKQGELGR